MFEWSDEQKMIKDAVRQFVEKEIAPHVEELEHGDTPPYDVLRKLFATFGMDVMAREGFKKRIEFEKQVEEAKSRGEDAPEKPNRGDDGGGMDPSFTMIPIIELCRYSPGMV